LLGDSIDQALVSGVAALSLLSLSGSAALSLFIIKGLGRPVINPLIFISLNDIH
jgi:hypothetical protein